MFSRVGRLVATIGLFLGLQAVFAGQANAQTQVSLGSCYPYFFGNCYAILSYGDSNPPGHIGLKPGISELGGWVRVDYADSFRGSGDQNAGSTLWIVTQHHVDAYNNDYPLSDKEWVETGLINGQMVDEATHVNMWPLLAHYWARNFWYTPGQSYRYQEYLISSRGPPSFGTNYVSSIKYSDGYWRIYRGTSQVAAGSANVGIGEAVEAGGETQSSVTRNGGGVSHLYRVRNGVRTDAVEEWVFRHNPYSYASPPPINALSYVTTLGCS